MVKTILLYRFPYVIYGWMIPAQSSTMFTVEAVEVDAESNTVQVRARHASGTSIVKDAAEFEPLKTNYEPTERRASRFAVGDKALCNGGLVIVKATDFNHDEVSVRK